MIGWTETPSSMVTPFLVVKKNSKLILIMDCRSTNLLFRAPPAPEMGTAAAWSNLERPQNEGELGDGGSSGGGS
eukprot:9285972-Pyramimonas_sp.AAC.1